MKCLNKINSPNDLKLINQEDLPELCKEIRRFLVASLSKTGGHLSSNLGVVELTVAMHYCLNSPVDKIIWDVGHQAYVHKIITGRSREFSTLRKFNGLSGFPKCSESIHDIFEVGHSSTSISAALGLAIARDLDKHDYNVVALIGDGSMTAGLSFEALNNAGRSNTNLIVIVNDNDMSITKNVGGLSKHFSDIRTANAYINTKKEVSNALNKIPKVGETLTKSLEKMKGALRHLVVPGVFFEQLGFKYFGYIDGHDISNLIKVINQAKKINGPVILHVHTTKGKGYKRAESNPEAFHGVEPFDIKTGNPLVNKTFETYSSVFGKKMTDIAEKNTKVVAVTAAMCSSVGLSEFAIKFPNRVFDVGIAEAHGVTFAAGLAKNNYIPFVCVYSTFLQRAYDQILHDVCNQNLHVIFCLDRAGLVGADGETHQGIFDIAYLAHIPNMTIIAPKNKRELINMLDFAVSHEGPIAIRYPRGEVCTKYDSLDSEIELAKCEYMKIGQKIAILSIGSMMNTAYEVYSKLIEDGYNPSIINCRFISPIDINMIKDLENYTHVFVLEEHVARGGFASLVLEQLSKQNITIQNFHSFSLPNEFIEHGDVQTLLEKYSLDTKSIYDEIKRGI
jgi:1-deoxy-D-xylulose-5-phosphate synthase